MTKHFDDLTAIDCFFGELDEDTQNRLFQAWRMAGEVQYRGCNDGAWARVTVPTWSAVAYYRVSPKPLTKPSIDWSHVAKEYRWLARDEDGEMWLYKEMPVNDDGWDACVWSAISGDLVRVVAFASYTPGTCDWRDSLVERPD